MLFGGYTKNVDTLIFKLKAHISQLRDNFGSPHPSHFFGLEYFIFSGSCFFFFSPFLSSAVFWCMKGKDTDRKAFSSSKAEKLYVFRVIKL